MTLHTKWLLFFIVFSSFVFGQKVEVSNTVKLTNKVGKFKVLGKMGDKYLVERFGSNLYFIDAYNSYLKQVSTKQIELEKNENLAKIWIQPNQGFVFKLLSGKDYQYLNAYKITSNLNIAQKPQLIDSIFERKDLLIENLRVSTSLNEQNLLFYLPIFSKGTVDYFYANVIDANAQSINKVLLRNDAAKDKKFVDILVFNDASVLLITKDDTEDTQEYYFTYADKNGKVNTKNYSFVQKLFKKPLFEIDNENKRVLISAFQQAAGERKNEPGAEAFFTIALNLPDFTTEYVCQSYFTPQFYTDLTGKVNEMDPPQLYTFYPNMIVPKKDGGALIVCESFFKNEEQTMNSFNMGYYSMGGMSTPSFTTYYNYMDVLVYDIDSTGNLERQGIIRKKQVSSNDGGSFSSFFIMNLRNELKLVYLDDISDEAHLNQASINEDTINKGFSLMNIASKRVIPIVKMTVQSSPNELLLPSYVNNRMQLVKITF